MRIAICEDDISLCSQLVEWLKSALPEDTTCQQIKAYHSADHLWFDYQGLIRSFDLIILDIELPGTLNGLDAAKKIRAMKDNVPIVILTAFTKYALAGYEVQPFHYLTKPVRKQKLLDIVGQVSSRLNVYWNDCLNLSVQGGFLRIPFDDILYIESRGHNVYIHTRQDKHKLYRKMDEILDLCDERFLYSHKSYAVNADMIKQIESRYTSIILRDGSKIPISQQKKASFVESLIKYDRTACAIQA